MAYRKATGRPMKVSRDIKTSRDLIRRHLRDHGKFISDLAPVWDMARESVYRRMYDSRRSLTPNYVETFIDWLKLDALDATRLRLHAARDAGWLINPDIVALLAKPSRKEPHA